MSQTQPFRFFGRFRRTSPRMKAAIALLLAIGTGSIGVQAQGPSGGAVRAGSAQISGEGTSLTQITQQSDRAVIDWRSFGIGAADQVVFIQPSAQSATLNRVTGDQVSTILGRLDANGQVLLINPNGIVFGSGAQVNVGGLIATTSNISNADFMAGRLVFDAPGRPGAGVLNAGAISARDSGLIALVAPHVRNDGIIVARLGRVMLGAADTFTIDLYGDALINLALSGANAGQLHGANGEPVGALITNAGRIETDGGQTVLITARGAKSILDNLINMSGTIKADTVVQREGRIVLLGEDGGVDVSGALSAQGATGGAIDVLGGNVHLASTASVDASGVGGGGAVHVGGAYQGGGDTYRSTATTIDAGAAVRANATVAGNGGEVVVWSDGRTEFAGNVEAKGGPGGGDGGRLEVSGKGSLDFTGQADASATAGEPGSLLLDPATLDIGVLEASAITRVLRTGTSASLQADNDINVNSAIYGGDRVAGGGLALNAGQNININDFIVTNNGAVTLNAAAGTVNIAPGMAVFSGNAPISVTTGATIHATSLFTDGALSIHSTAGSVSIDSIIDGHGGPVSIEAAGTVDINQSIINFAPVDDALTVTAGDDVNVNAQVDGRGGVEGGGMSVTAGHDVNVNQAMVTNNGAMALTANGGAINVASGTPMVSGTGAMALNAQGNVTAGPTSAGALTIASTAGSVAINGLIDAATGATHITAATDVNINDVVANGRSGEALVVDAGRDVNVNKTIDGRGGAAGGSVTLNAGRNLHVNDHVLTNDGDIDLTASTGTLTVASGKGTFAGDGAITMQSAGTLTTGAVTAGSLSATSTGSSVRVEGVIDGDTGRVDLTAATDVAIDQPVLNIRTGHPFNATAGRDVIVNAQIDGRNGATGGAVALTAGRNVAVDNFVVTNNGAITMTASGGTVTMAPGTALASGNGQIALTALGDVTTRSISAGSLKATSTGASVNVDGVIDGNTGQVELTAGHDINVNQPVLNLRTGASFNASAGQNINIDAPIDATGGATGGAVHLTAGGDLIVNANITTNNGAIEGSATNGVATVAPAAGLYAGTGSIGLDALGTVSTGTMSGGAVDVTSRGGSVAVSGQISGTGPMTIDAAGQVDIDHPITNPSSAAPLTITAGTDINVNAPVGVGADATTPSGSVAMTAGQDVNLNDSVVTKDAAIDVTATNGTVNAAAGEGLFAGSGGISVESGQDLSTFTTATTGALSLRSTGGSVNVDTAIPGVTGPVTIDAAADVNVNQGISNPRSDAPLAITAGHDINVNAPVDGRDDVLPGPSGAITMTAGNDLNVNEDIVSQDAAISLTATAGSITPAGGKGVYAGSGDISETSGQTLDTGITSTTGSLTLRSTGGAVNVNTKIPDTVGSVTISAGTDVNINQTVTNLKSGGNLSVTAGHDINVLAPVDGRAGVAAGGTVTMTAGNDLNLPTFIATNDGAVNLTATAGTVWLPVGTESFGFPMQWVVSAGSAPVGITTGGFFWFSSPVSTTGSLHITSTGGTVSIAAPITNDTGAVTITAADAIRVNHQVKSNNQPITLNAGPGGITVNPITDYDTTETSPVNSGTADLTFNSVGDVSILDGRGISSQGTVTIDTRGQIVTGSIGNSTSSPSETRPAKVVLNADDGIVFFSTGNVGEVDATSSGGSINLFVENPGKLRVTTGTPGTLDCPTCDITVTATGAGNFISPDVVLNAGGSINLPDFRTTNMSLTARSGDINLNLAIGNLFTADAGRDIVLNSLVWMDGGLSLTAGRDIVTSATSPIHLSGGSSLTMTAGRDLTLNILETLGPVSLTATTGDITLNNDIGPHIVNLTSDPDFNPSDLGVASLTMSAPASTATITMQGARAEGDVTITTGGSLTAAKEITSVSGTVSITTGGSQTVAPVPIGNQDQLSMPGFVSPVVAPGPPQLLPTAPTGVSASGPGAPAFAEIPVSAADQTIGGIMAPGAANGAVSVAGTPGGALAPGNAGGFTGAPTGPGGPGETAPGGSSGGTTDTAAALRTASDSCDEKSQSSGDNGLAALTPGKSTDGATQKNASCEAGDGKGQSASAPGSTPRGGTPKGTTPSPAAPAAGGR